MLDFLKKFFDEKFFKFIIVGVINTLVGMGIMFGLYNLANLKALDSGYWFQDMGYWISSAANYILTSILSYFLNKHFTFKNKEKGGKPVIRFALNIAICYLLAYGIAKPVTVLILGGTGLSQSAQTNIAMLAGSVFFVGFNYIGQRFFAFKEKPSQDTLQQSKGQEKASK